jgi:U2-associated protein SR140
MRHHIGAPPEPNSDSSSDEDDAFSAFNRKKPKKGKSINGPAKSENYTKNEDTHKARDIHKNFGEPSSKKRYHFQSNTRGAKMDALLQELQETSTHVTASSTDRAPLEKMGSFVTPDEEPFTTNIFVGNLAPVTTEEELTEIFRQFGALLS